MCFLQIRLFKFCQFEYVFKKFELCFAIYSGMMWPSSGLCGKVTLAGKYYCLILKKEIGQTLFLSINFFLSNLWEMNKASFIKKDLNIQINAWLIFCLSPLPVTSY